MLAQTLGAVAEVRTSGFDWQLIVVDNAGDPETRRVAESFGGRLPLTFLVETQPGKNSALNTALAHAKGDLVVCTDDDVIPRPDWLEQLFDGVRRWPAADFFGGRILPRLPPGASLLPLPEDLQASVYVIADWKQDEGPCGAWQVWGPNSAYRASVFARGFRFNTGIGPRGTDYAMGSEAEFNFRLEKAGLQCVYLPHATVEHVIRPEQCDPEWVFGRAQRQGRGEVVRYGIARGASWAGAPRYLWRMWCEALLAEWKLRAAGSPDWYRAAYKRHVLFGKIRQARISSAGGNPGVTP
jgi:glycosyltransferase involved in cell wall biosynthesis